MSYASLAGLPLSFGLYGALVPCLVFMLFATSRQLVSKQVFVQHAAALRSATPYITGPSSLPSCQAVGPVSITSMLLGSGLRRIFDGRINADPNHPDDPQLQAEYNQAAIQVGGAVSPEWHASELPNGVVHGHFSVVIYVQTQSLCRSPPCQVAFLCGLIYTAVGLLRLGTIVNFLSHSVMSGFMSGASLVIASSQVRPS